MVLICQDVNKCRLAVAHSIALWIHGYIILPVYIPQSIMGGAGVLLWYGPECFFPPYTRITMVAARSFYSADTMWLCKIRPQCKGFILKCPQLTCGMDGDWNTLRLNLSCFRVVVGSLSSVSTWSPLQVMADHSSSDILIPLNPTDPQPGTLVLKTLNIGLDPESSTYKEDRSILKTLPCTSTIILDCLKLTLVPVDISYLV